MSIIQNIRDKAAWIIIGAIALALIAFIVQDAFQNQSMFSGSPNTLGVVNGNDIDAVDFEEKYKRSEDQYRNAGYPVDDMLRQNIRDGIWNEYVDDAIMGKKYSALGIAVPDQELSDILYGANPPQDLKQQFTDPNTGLYDANAAYQQIQALRKQKSNPMYKSFFGQYLPALSRNRQKEKYITMLSNSVYVPKWMVEKINADNSLKSAVSYVSISYSTIPDSLVIVSDDEINKYVNNHKEQFKQETSRAMEYVVFDASPTKSDSVEVFDRLQALKDELATTVDIQAFLIRNAGETPFFDGFVLKSKMQMANADSLQQLPVGGILGPYIDGGKYLLARMMDKRSLPDSVKCRHILIKSADEGQPVLADSSAKKRIDSIVGAINGGASFDSMVVKYSDDPGSKEKKGEYEFSSVQLGELSREFAEVIFYGKTGDKKTVKVDNSKYTGYHYIEVLSQKNFEPAFKVAYFSLPILPSKITDNSVMGLASQFAGESRNRKSFEKTAKKKNIPTFKAADIKPLTGTIPGLGSSREIVKWMYEAEVGEVSDKPYQVGDKYVVAVLTDIYEEGVMIAERARPQVEHLVRNQKKSEQIIKKAGNANSLETIGKNTGQPVMRVDSIFFNSPFIPNVGQELKVVGAAFNKQNQTAVSPPLVGNSGVFFIKVENIGAVANPNFDVRQQQLTLQQQQQQMIANPQAILDVLKKDAKIKDNRHKFF